jgi:hypothetical protein
LAGDCRGAKAGLEQGAWVHAPESGRNRRYAVGTAFEDAIAKLAGKRLGGRVTKREKVYRDELTPCDAPLTCHIDGIIKGCLYEAKTASSFSFSTSWGKDRIPAYYQAQVQHNLLLTGLKKAVVVCLEFPETPDKWEAMGWYVCHERERWLLQNEDLKRSIEPDAWAHTLAEMGFFHLYTITADKTARLAMLDSYVEFWESIRAEQMPEPENYDDIKRLFPEPKGTIIVPQAVEIKLREYREITEELGETGPQAKRRDQLKVEILSWARTRTAVLDDESTESLIMRNEAGEKCGSFSKTKKGTLVFRT